MSGTRARSGGGPPRWYATLLLALAALRLAELRLSAVNEAAAGGTRAAPRSYPVMVAAHAGLFALPLLEASRRRPRAPAWGWAGVLAAALVLRLWSIRTLGGAWNVRAAVPAGVRPVVAGPYRFIRHPNYLAVILEFAAVPMLAGARASALLLSALNAAVLFDRIRAEERLLERSVAYRKAFAGRARFFPGVF